MKFTDDEEKKIIFLYRKKLMNTEEIGKRIGCSKYPIKIFLKNNNLCQGISKRRKILSKANKLKIWNRGLKISSNQKVKKNVKNLIKKNKLTKGKTYEEIYGKKKAEKIKKTQSISNSLSKIGPKNPMYGRKQTEKWKKMRRNLKLPFRDSSIEIKVQNFLKLLNIEFFKHQYIKEIEHGYQCDILIPIQNDIHQKTIIECDGDYWHGNKDIFPKPNKLQIEQIEEDRIRTKELIEKGFKVLRLWENKIKKMTLIEFSNGVLSK